MNTKSTIKDKIRISEIIELAWDDETSFDAIEAQTGFTEKEVIQVMRTNMKPSSFRMWRKRVTGRASKHELRRLNRS
ncbi:MAG: TIGR03643 family protein [Pseudomonadota bacterium]